MNASKKNKDENYVLDLCDQILEISSSRQHRFNFLLGDLNKKGIAAKLPVDAYYLEKNLVIEYHERQHTETVVFFDKPTIITISGVNRGEQRKIYDERRRVVLAEHKILLIEFSFLDFNYNKQKKIIRDYYSDKDIVTKKLSSFI